ncbi:MAG: autotransporter-associated beta strand repeat-containing protein [Puniceicoccales bacterium]|jgi:autotransporter-associated beta strand protein|nr:autotransporter-associated beta strand repeat-containing protein [Puniceicoccales bacterium]
MKKSTLVSSILSKTAGSTARLSSPRRFLGAAAASLAALFGAAATPGNAAEYDQTFTQGTDFSTIDELNTILQNTANNGNNLVVFNGTFNLNAFATILNAGAWTFDFTNATITSFVLRGTSHTDYSLRYAKSLTLIGPYSMSNDSYGRGMQSRGMQNNAYFELDTYPTITTDAARVVYFEVLSGNNFTIRYTGATPATAPARQFIFGNFEGGAGNLNIEVTRPDAVFPVYRIVNGHNRGTNNLPFTKLGPGTLSIVGSADSTSTDGNNAFGGTLTVAEGTLMLGKTDAMFASSGSKIVINPGATLQLFPGENKLRNFDLKAASVISAGTPPVAGVPHAGTETISLSATGTVSIAEGTVVLVNVGASGTTTTLDFGSIALPTAAGSILLDSPDCTFSSGSVVIKGQNLTLGALALASGMETHVTGIVSAPGGGFTLESIPVISGIFEVGGASQAWNLVSQTADTNIATVGAPLPALLGFESTGRLAFGVNAMSGAAAGGNVFNNRFSADVGRDINLHFSTGGEITLAGAITLDGGNLRLTADNGSSPVYTLSGSVTNKGGAGGIVANGGTLRLGRASPDAVVIGLPISGTAGLTHASGHTILSATASHTGGTNITGGTLALVGTASIPNSPSVTLSAGGQFVITDTTVSATIRGLNGSGGEVLLGGKTLFITGNGTDNAGNFGGVIRGDSVPPVNNGVALSLNAPNASLTLSGSNTFLGKASVEDGRLVVKTPAALGLNSTVEVKATPAAGKTGILDFNFDNSVTAELGRLVSGNGVLLKSGAASSELVVRDANAVFTGTVRLEEGTLRLAGSGAFDNAAGFVITGGVLDVAGSATTVSLKTLDGAGAGRVVLGGNVLRIGSGGVTATGGGDYAGSILDGPDAGTGGGRLWKTGTGGFVLRGEASHSRGTTISAGTLTLADDGTANARLSGGGALEMEGTGTKLVLAGALSGAQLNPAADLRIAARASQVALALGGNAETVASLSVGRDATAWLEQAPGAAGARSLTVSGGAALGEGSEFFINGEALAVDGLLAANGRVLRISGAGGALNAAGGLALNMDGTLTVASGTTLGIGTEFKAVRGVVDNLSASAITLPQVSKVRTDGTDGSGDIVILRGTAGYGTPEAVSVTGGVLRAETGFSLDGGATITQSGWLAARGASGLVTVAGALTLNAPGGGLEALGGGRFSIGSLAARNGVLRSDAQGGAAPFVVAGDFRQDGAIAQNAGVLRFTDAGTSRVVLDAARLDVASLVVGGGVFSVGRAADLHVTGGDSVATVFAPGTALEFNLAGADPDVPRLRLLGGTFDGASLAGVSVNVTNATGLQNATYLLLDASGVANLLNPLTGGGQYYINGTLISEPIRDSRPDGVAFGGLSLISETKLGLTYVASSQNTLVRWSGEAGNNRWADDSGTLLAKNWRGLVSGIAVTTYLDGDTVEFADTVPNVSGVGSTTVPVSARSIVAARSDGTTAGAVLRPASISVTTSGRGANGWRIGGGVIADFDAASPTTLVKNGEGDLTLSSANAFTGTVSVNGGTLVLEHALGAGTGTAALNLAAGSTTLVFDIAPAAASASAFTRPVTGSGALVKRGDGRLLLSSTVTSTGAATVSGGVLELAPGASITGAASVAIGDGATLSLAAGALVSTPGGASFGGASVFQVSGGVTLEDFAASAGAVPLRAGGTLAFTGGVGATAGRVDISGYSGEGEYVVAHAGQITTSAPLVATVNGRELPPDLSLSQYINLALSVTPATGSLSGDVLVVRENLVWFNAQPGKQHGTFDIPGAGDVFSIGTSVRNGVDLVDNSSAVSWGGYDGWDGRSLTKRGAGELVLELANSYTGATNLFEGTLTLRTVRSAGAGGAAVHVNGGVLRFDLSEAESGVFAKPLDGSGKLLKSGVGTLRLEIANPGFTGAVEVAGGRLSLGNSGALGVGGAPLSIAADGTLSLDAPAMALWDFAKSITGSGKLVKDGLGEVRLTAANPGFSGEVFVNTGTLSLLSVDAAGPATGPVAVHLVNAGAALSLGTPAGASWEFARPLDGPGALLKSGPGELVLSVASPSHGGAIRVAQGVLELRGAEVAAAVAAPVDVSAGATLRVSIPGPASGGAVPVLSAGLSGAGALEKTGAGALALTGDNLLAGPTFVREGTLVLRNVNGAGSNDSAALTLAGEDTVLRFEVPAGDIWTYRHTISGKGSIEKDGAGTLTLFSPESYAGATSVRDGALHLNAVLDSPGASDAADGADPALSAALLALPGAALHTGAVSIVTADASLHVNTASSQIFSGTLDGAGTLIKNGVETLALAGASTLSGATRVEAGTLLLTAPYGAPNAAGNPVYGSPVFIGDGARLEIAQGAGVTQFFRGAFTGAGSIVKTGAGTLALTGALNHTGGTFVRGGTLQVGATHGDLFAMPQTLTVPSLTLARGATVAFDVYGDYLSDKIETGAVSLEAGAGDAKLVFDISNLTPGAYVLLANETALGDIWASPSDFIQTLLNGAEIAADSLLQARYVLDHTGKNLVLQITGADEFDTGNYDDSGSSRKISWDFNATSGRGVWDVSSANWRRAADSGSGAQLPTTFQQADIVTFDAPARTQTTISFAQQTRVGSLHLGGEGDVTFVAGTLLGVSDSSRAGADGVLSKTGSGKTTFRDSTLNFRGGAVVEAGTLRLSNTTLALPASAGNPLGSGTGALADVRSAPLSGASPAAVPGGLSVASGATLLLGDGTRAGTPALSVVEASVIRNAGRIEGEGTLAAVVVNNGTLAPVGNLVLKTSDFDNSAGILEFTVSADGVQGTIGYAGTKPIEVGGTIRIILEDNYFQSHVQRGKVLLPALVSPAAEDSEQVAFSPDVVLSVSSSHLVSSLIDPISGVVELSADFATLPALPTVLRPHAPALDALAGAGDEYAAITDALLRASDEAVPGLLRAAIPYHHAALVAIPLGNARATQETLLSRAQARRASAPNRADRDIPGSAREILAGKPAVVAPAPHAANVDAWLQLDASFTDNNSVSRSPAKTTNSQGIHAGLDVDPSENLLLGVAFSGNHSKATYLDNAGQATAEHFRATAYASYSFTRFFHADLQLGGGYASYDAKRRLSGEFEQGVFSTRTYTASPEGSDYGASLNLGARIPLRGSQAQVGSIHLGPTLGVQYTHASVDAFSEKGPAGRHAIDAYGQDSLLLRVGATVDWRLALLGRPLCASLSLSYARELADHSTMLSGRFVDVAPLPGVDVNTTPENYLSISPSIDYSPTSSITVRATYAYETSLASQQAHRVSLSASYRF